jgi:hypothetical protein
MGMSSAVKMQRLRQRERDDEIMLKITVRQTPTVETLCEAGELPYGVDHCLDDIARAVERFLKVFERERIQ